MRYYPLFADLRGKTCLVVGAGAVGQRKIATLAACGPAEVLVLDTTEPGPEAASFFSQAPIRFERREFQESDLDGRGLVIASTSSEETNLRISRLCAARGIFVNVVDQPDKCSFIVPALYTQGDLTVAVSTGGASPAMAKRIRKMLGQVFHDGFGPFLALLSRLRPVVLTLGWPTEHNSELFRSLVQSKLIEHFEHGDMNAARALLHAALPEQIHPQVDELLHELQ